MSYCILTFDGGGIRGIFSARIVQRLEEKVPGFVGKTKLISGTSTGGVIALGLAAGMTAAELVTLYQSKAKQIFDDSLFDNIIDLGHLVGAQYGNANLKKVLVTEFEEKRNKRTLNDLNTRVLIPSFDLDNYDDPRYKDKDIRRWKAKFFHNFPGSDSDGNQLVVNVAMRTSAAPTYFPSYQGYIDGGVVTNNPSVSALAQALHNKMGRQQLTDVRLLSIGTGKNPSFIQGMDLNWGWGQWARPLVSLMLDGVTDVPHYQCAQILDEAYHRIDVDMPWPIPIDTTERAKLNELIALADSYDINAAVAWLQTNWSA